MPTLLRRSLALLRAPANQLAFAVRSRLRWSRGAVRLPHEDKRDLFDWLEGEARSVAEARAAQLEARFDLAALRRCSSQLVFAENLALLDRLVRLAGSDPVPTGADGSVSALDIGSGVFQYATALQRWLRQDAVAPSRPVALRGLEIDGFGVYRDGHSRADHAIAHAALAGPGTSFEVGDVTRLCLPPQDVVSLFFPFLSAYPLLRWGSPLTHLRPRRLLRRAVATVRVGGWLVIANQTVAEFERLRALLAGQPLQFVRQVPFGSDLVPYAARTVGRVGSLWQRT